MKTVPVEKNDKSNFDSPVFPGKPLSLAEFRKWISDAENAPSISLSEAKEKWENKKNLLGKLTK